jgi:D-aspartate ligase
MDTTSRSESRPAIVAGLTLNGATVLRRLTHLGYAAWGVSFEPGEPGWQVGGAHHHRVPDPRADFEGWVEALLELATTFEEPPPVLPMSDVYVVAFDRAAPRLEGHYRLHGFGNGLRTSLTSKRGTFELAEEHDFPRPASRWVESRDELASFAEGLASPVLVKPDFTYQWRNSAAQGVIGTRKVGTGRDIDALLSTYDEIASVTPAVLAQEVIPGPDSNLLYWCGFVGPEGRVGGRLVGRKRRIVPIHYGSATFVELVDAPDVEDQCERFLTALGYRGLCGIELKVDPRDGVAKLIEVNPRYSLWDDIGIPVGVDLAHEAVRAFDGVPTEARRPRHFRQKWVELGRDLPAALEYRKEGLLSLGAWLWSLRPPIVVNDLPILQDPGYAYSTVSRRVRKLTGRIGSTASSSPRHVLAKAD